MSTETVEGVAETPQVATPASIEGLEPKMQLKGTVKRLELYGAFIDIGLEDVTALVHISKIGGDQVNRVSDVLNEGDEVVVWVEKVDPERQQVMVSMVEPVAVDWSDLEVGQEYAGTVTRLENFGAFVNIGAEREGLVHISELSHDYVKNPSEVVRVGDEVQVKVLNYNRRKRRIDLSMKALIEAPERETAPQPKGKRSSGSDRDYAANREEYVIEEDEVGELPTAMEIALRRALGNETISNVKDEQRAAKKRKKQEAKRQAQEELLDRTLQMQSDN